jgi:ABC-2 type transport system ATP-binding protein
METQPESIIISARNMVKKFGQFTANDHLNFEVYRGEIFGFLGANGAGKTTAIRILCGLSTPTSGEITVAGMDVTQNTNAIKKKIGYMSQKFSLYEDLTVWENIRFFAGIYGMPRKEIKSKASKMLALLKMEDVKDTLIASLPTGWRQKLAFSIALFHNPAIVFLDEPTGGVDPITRRQFWEMICEAARNGVTVFVTTHYMDEAEYCDRVCIMTEGKIIALDTPANLKQIYQAATMDEVFRKVARNVE